MALKLGYLFFWVYDLISNRILSQTIDDLEASYSNGKQASALPLLYYAINHVPYYQALKYSTVELERFPVVNKEVIRKDQNLFFSNAYTRGGLIKGKTSGSNGIPFHFYWCKNKSLVRTAEIIYYNRWVGYDVGDDHLLNAVGVNKSKLKLFIQKEIIANPRSLSDKWFAQQRKDLIDRKIPYYIGYGSVIDQFSRYCEERGDAKESFHLKGIISTAEQLPEYARQRAESIFGCPVLRRYATLETGVLAHECPEERRLHVNSENYHIEFLKLNSDEPAMPGETARIVVTDLNSYAMPLIRYDIGDLAVIDNRVCGCGRKGVVIKELTGRRADSLIGKQGQTVSWIAISDVMWSFPNIEQFQIIQISRCRFIVNVVSHTGYDKSSLVEKFKALLGGTVDIQLIDVDVIERLDSGKSRVVINEMESYTALT